jgi:hypothetical protein
MGVVSRELQMSILEVSLVAFLVMRVEKCKSVLRQEKPELWMLLLQHHGAEA